MKRGTIETLKLFKLFKGLYDQRASGWLLLKTGHVERRVYLQEGAPASVISTAPQEQLLWRCVYEGVCSSSEAAQFEEKINTNEVKLSELLVNSGIASKSRIHQLSIDLISDLIWDCLSWSAGDFGWTTDGAPTGDLTPVDPFYLLCMSGQESLTDDLRSFIQQQIEGQSAQLASLNTDELNVLRELLGDQLVQRLTQGCDLNALISLVFQTAPEEKQLFLTNIIYALLVSGFFHLGDIQDQPAAQPGSSRVTAQPDSSPSDASPIAEQKKRGGSSLKWAEV